MRLIRTIRPDVIITLPPTGNAGGQHHMASAVITRDAYKLAADPAKYPEQIKEGLRPWQPKKLYHIAGSGSPASRRRAGTRHCASTPSVYDPLLGKTYARDRHRSAQHAQVPGHGAAARAAGADGARSAISSSRRRLPARRSGTRASLFDGIDTSVMSLAQFVDRRACPKDLTDGLDGDLERRPDRAEDLRHGQRRGDR